MNTILFDPCMGLSQYSLQCSGVSELKSKVFKRVCKDKATITKITEPKYCSRVLQGNWFEERIHNSPISYDCTDLSAEISKPQLTADNVNDNFAVAKLARDKTRGMTRNLLVNDNNTDYQRNFSTVYDLSYRLLPQGLNGPRLRSYNSRSNKWIPEQDLTENFGNVTGYGMKEYIEALQEELIDSENERAQTNYQCDYKKKILPMIVKRFHKKRIDLNVPNLDHLNIDLNTCWSRYIGLGYRKNDLCQRIACGRY